MPPNIPKGMPLFSKDREVKMVSFFASSRFGLTTFSNSLEKAFLSKLRLSLAKGLTGHITYATTGSLHWAC